MKLNFYFLVLTGVLICLPTTTNAQDSDGNLVATTAAGTSIDASQATTAPAASPDSGFIHDWLSMVSETQSEQPHWMTPVATTTPRLEQEFRYDVATQPHNSGLVTDNFGFNKGLEIIPAKRWEIILAVPPYVVDNPDSAKNGFGDWQFLIKYRILSSNEEHGNYILTAFFQMTAPTGQYEQGNPSPVITPTIAYGKGWGDFDVQGTLGVSLPTGNIQTIGRTIPWNNTFQYHLWKKFWPEMEVNFTHYYQGSHDGMTSVYLTPGIVLGRFKIHDRFAFAVGGGYEIAVTQFHPTNHVAICSVRFPF
jgi:hypothetical protein